jgi:hypothetical protein
MSIPTDSLYDGTTATGGQHYVPHAVVSLMIDHEWSPMRAWRVHLGLSRELVAMRLALPTEALVRLENAHSLEMHERTAVATALGLAAELLDL